MRILFDFFSSDFLRYAAVGGATACLYFGCIFGLVEFGGYQGVIPVTIAYVVALLFHFSANKIYTFRRMRGDVFTETRRYIVVASLNYFVTLIAVYGVVDYLGYSTYLGAVLAIAATLALGYGMTKFWVFQQDGIRRG